MSGLAPVNPALARIAVEEFFADANWQRRIEECGWTVSQVDSLTVIVAIAVTPSGGQAETYTLRLSCEYYPTHPPDVRFVNPHTLAYELATDKQYLPDLRAPFCYVHASYPYSQSYSYAPQLVCNSFSLGYYVSGHAPTPDQQWQPGRHTLGTAIQTVYRALHSEHYQGRMAA